MSILDAVKQHESSLQERLDNLREEVTNAKSFSYIVKLKAEDIIMAEYMLQDFTHVAIDIEHLEEGEVDHEVLDKHIQRITREMLYGRLSFSSSAMGNIIRGCEAEARAETRNKLVFIYREAMAANARAEDAGEYYTIDKANRIIKVAINK